MMMLSHHSSITYKGVNLCPIRLYGAWVGGDEASWGGRMSKTLTRLHRGSVDYDVALLA
ncbi:hypothetical protein Hanom_Chr04g00363411 [Helianthus anomalus]